MTTIRSIPLAAAAIVGLTLAAYALAGSNGTVASYTGCLKNGKLDSINTGDAPLAPCGTGATQVQLSGGDITAVAAGTGLTGGADNGDVTLAADPAAVQTRVTGRCDTNLLSDASITAINQDGTVVCNPDDQGPSTDVFSGFHDGPETIPVSLSDTPQIAHLALPSGRYAIIATLTVENDGEVSMPVACRLQAGSDFDQTPAALGPQFQTAWKERLTLQVVHDFTDPGDAIVGCSDFPINNGSGTWSYLKITATRVAGLTNQPLPVP